MTSASEAAEIEQVERLKRIDLTRGWYRIGEVAALAEVEPHTIRFWETQFVNLRFTRSKRGQRIYTRKVVELVLRIKHLLHVELYTIAGAKRRLRTAEICHCCGAELGEPK